MVKYRKKPVVIDAFQYAPDDHRWPEWAIAAANSKIIRDQGDGVLLIQTLEGVMCGDRGDWIIRGVKNEIYPCKPEIFALTYEPADTGC